MYMYIYIYGNIYMYIYSIQFHSIQFYPKFFEYKKIFEKLNPVFKERVMFVDNTFHI